MPDAAVRRLGNIGTVAAQGGGGAFPGDAVQLALSNVLQVVLRPDPVDSEPNHGTPLDPHSLGRQLSPLLSLPPLRGLPPSILRQSTGDARRLLARTLRDWLLNHHSDLPVGVQLADHERDTLLRLSVAVAGEPDASQEAVRTSDIGATANDDMIDPCCDALARCLLTSNPHLKEKIGTVPIGRDQEVDRIIDALASAISSQQGHFVVVEGCTGTGKSCLLEYARHVAVGLGYTVASVVCEPFHEGMSFFPVREMVSQLAADRSILNEVQRLFGTSSNEARIAQQCEDINIPSTERRDALITTLTNVVFGRFHRQSSETPLLLSIDDLERADLGTLDALMWFLSNMNQAPVVVMSSFRTDLCDGDTGAVRTVLSAAYRAGRLVDIAVKDFDRSVVPMLVDEMLGATSSLPRRFYDALYTHTDGNPLFVREFLLALTRSNVQRKSPLVQTDRVWSMDLEPDNWTTPKSLEDAIVERLSHLEQAQLAALEAASVIGRRFAYSVLANLELRTESDLLSSVEKLMGLELVREVPEEDELFEFSHGKIRDVLYERMSNPRRRRLHSQVADILDDVANSTAASVEMNWDALIGEHLYRAGRYLAAAGRCLDAARWSMNFLAIHDAASQYDLVASCCGQGSQGQGPYDELIQLEHGEALKLAGRIADAERVLAPLKASASTSVRGWALNHLGDTYEAQLQFQRATDAYQASLLCADEALDRELGCESAADLAESWGRRFVLERAYPHREAQALQAFEQYERWIAVETELANRLEDALGRARLLRNLGVKSIRISDYATARSYLEDAIVLLSERSSFHRSHVLLPLSIMLRLVGQPVDALNHVDAVLSWSLQRAVRKSEAMAREQRGLILYALQGSQSFAPSAEAVHEVRLAAEIYDELDYQHGCRGVRRILGEWDAMSGNLQGATAHWSECYPEARPEEPLWRCSVRELQASGELARADALERHVG